MHNIIAVLSLMQLLAISFTSTQFYAGTMYTALWRIFHNCLDTKTFTRRRHEYHYFCVLRRTPHFQHKTLSQSQSDCVQEARYSVRNFFGPIFVAVAGVSNISTILTWIVAALTALPLCINHERAWEIRLMGVAPVKGVEATLYSCKKQADTKGIGSDHYQDKILCISMLNING
ncbi:hypothetical protein C8J57DRAFT_1248070 [Mycena rebaudengoi]|nr:hypothetical protein C8J57DRAFT_1248070 [Mycena rebaudengoi]